MIGSIEAVEYFQSLIPEGAAKGGTVIATGTPEEVVKCDKSYTGKFLKPLL